MDRRKFLTSAAACVVSASFRAAHAESGRLPIRKAVLVSMLPKGMSYTDRFKLAKDVGFEAVECQTTKDPNEAEEIKTAAEAAHLRIPSVMNMDHWKYPLSSEDPEVLATRVAGLQAILHN